MKLEGTLATFPLRELIDMIVYSSVTGALNIYGPGDHGRLYFRDGVLTHVEHGQSTGVEALAELLELQTASFTFVSGATTEAETTWGSLHHHLQSAERLAARWRQLRPYLPHLELVPALLVAPEAAARRVPQGHQPILAAIDGQRNLHQLALVVGWAEIDLAEGIVQMTVDGLLDLRGQRQSTQSGPTPEALHQAGGLFDRLRAHSARS